MDESVALFWWTVPKEDLLKAFRVDPEKGRLSDKGAPPACLCGHSLILYILLFGVLTLQRRSS